MRRLSFYLLAFLLFVSNSFAFYQFFESYQQDPASRALGQAEILTTQGGNAIFSNPANLMGVSNLTVNLGGYGINSYRPDYQEEPTEHTLIITGNGVRLSHASIARSFDEPEKEMRFVLAAGYQRTLDWNLQYYGIRIFEHGANMLGIGGAVVCNNTMAVGLGVVHSLPGDELYSPSQRYKENFKYSITMYNLGVQYKVSERFELGLSFRPSYKMTIKDMNVEYVYVTNDSMRIDYEDMVYSMPSVVGLACKGDVTSSITLHAEIQTRNWKNWYSKAWESHFDSNLEMGAAYRFGIEWRGPVTLRGGIYNTAILLEDEAHDNIPKTRTGLTFGAGINYRQFALDPYMNYEWVYYGPHPLYEEATEQHTSSITLGVGISFVKP